MSVPLLSRGWLRKACAITIFLAAALVQVFFKNIPWPLNVESVDKLRNASAALAAQEIVITDASVSPHHTFLTYQGDPFETVDLDFDRARLGDATASLLSSFPPAPPLDPAPWHFIANEDRSAGRGEACRAFFNIAVSGDQSARNEFHLLQLGNPGLNHMRHMEVRTDAAPLLVNVKTEWPAGKENKAIGCHKRLQSGEWFRGVLNHPIQFVVSPHSSFRINFVSLSDAAPAWGGPDKPFRSAEFGPLLARELAVRPIQEDGSVAKGPPALHLTAYRNSQLRVKDLQIQSDALQVALSGTAWSSLDGKTQGFDLWDAMGKNAMFAALLSSANVLLLAWLRRLFFGGTPKPRLSDATSDA
jgi:hypothetical protein